MHHHKLIRSLIIEIRKLRHKNANLSSELSEAQDCISSLEYSQEESNSRLSHKLRQAQAEADDFRRADEDRQYEIKRLSTDLEKARSCRNTYEEDRIMRRLREI